MGLLNAGQTCCAFECSSFDTVLWIELRIEINAAVARNAVAVDRLPVVQVLAWTWLMGSSQGAVAESFLADRTAGA